MIKSSFFNLIQKGNQNSSSLNHDSTGSTRRISRTETAARTASEDDGCGSRPQRGKRWSNKRRWPKASVARLPDTQSVGPLPARRAILTLRRWGAHRPCGKGITRKPRLQSRLPAASVYRCRSPGRSRSRCFAVRAGRRCPRSIPLRFVCPGGARFR